MAENRFAKYKDGGAAVQGGNRFAKYKTATPQATAKTDREAGPQTASGALKALGSGVAKGVMGLAGTVGDVQQMTGDAAGWVAGRFGASPETKAAVSGVARRIAVPGIGAQAPGSGQIRQGVETVTGPMYEPQTTGERYLDTIGQFAPNVMAGPGGMGRKAALTVAPAVASEFVGQQTEGSWVEPFARAGTAMAVGMPIAAKGMNKPLKEMREAAPTQEANYAAKNKAYKDLDSAGIVYNPGSLQRMVKDLEATFAAKGADPVLHPQSTALLNYIKGRVKGRPSFQDIDNIRKNVGGVLRSKAENADKAFASMIMERLDQFEKAAPLSSNAGLKTSDVKAMAGNARELARRDILSKQIDDMEGAMEGYRYGVESGLGNQFGSYLRNKQKRNNLTQAEREAFRAVVAREGLEGLATAAGSNLGKVVQIGGSIAAAPATGGMSLLYGAAGLAGNAAARKFAASQAQKAVDRARQTVLAGRKAQNKAMKEVGRNRGMAAGQTLLGTNAAVHSSDTPPFFMQDAAGNVYPYPGGLLGVPR